MIANVPKKREPIFNQTPLGVAGLIGAILTAHIVSLLVGFEATQSARGHYGVVPYYIISELSHHRIVARDQGVAVDLCGGRGFAKSRFGKGSGRGYTAYEFTSRYFHKIRY